MQSKFILPAAMLMLSLYACTKQNDDSKKPIIDYATYGYVSNWVEIPNGNTLSIFSNSIDPIKGEYLYKGVRLGINIDSSGFIQQTDSSFNFISRGLKDTTTLQYKIYGDSLLVIQNQSAEIKYRKVR
ncbi:hypothetical protein [Chitinophaga niabensis]|uniref:Lipocalin-like domain-containing protein n=1 Tax=Chitinophaga niabensis TaxID=536979 RepID=A0A1N6GIJ8_9BACT|nr:hypothetical protein [Chitinophaga niabensis]SIO07324.1 hypothetical protein SAMN04488055_2791 [Chitinophaga niabensis]